jgi:hypothetical protein
MHVDELILFSGTKEEAVAMAMLDDDSYFVDSILGYKDRTTNGYAISYSF